MNDINDILKERDGSVIIDVRFCSFILAAQISFPLQVIPSYLTFSQSCYAYFVSVSTLLN